MLGRNGVGKSTLLLTIMGYTQLGRGTIRWHGRDITRELPHRRALDGLGWVAQEREIFPSLSVEENLTVAARPGRWRLGAVYDLFPRLAERRGSRGNHLSGGEQQMLAIARALMTNPALLMLDEPLEGLAPIIVEELTAAMRRMTADEGTAFILVEQHAEIALSLTAMRSCSSAVASCIARARTTCCMIRRRSTAWSACALPRPDRSSAPLAVRAMARRKIGESRRYRRPDDKRSISRNHV